MMAISNADGDSIGAERKRKKIAEQDWKKPPLRKWRSDAELKIYSSKLLDALRRVRSSAHGFARSRAIREAADRALAVSARGRTGWSRAILSNRKLNLKRRRPAAWSLKPKPSLGVRSAEKKSRASILEGKAAVLGRLVPGSRKLSFPLLLEEAADYIAALQMQIRAMSSLTTILSDSGGIPLPDSYTAAP